MSVSGAEPGIAACRSTNTAFPPFPPTARRRTVPSPAVRKPTSTPLWACPGFLRNSARVVTKSCSPNGESYPSW